MKCNKIRELLRDYLRRETDPKTGAGVARHLETCDDCARELEFLKGYYAKIESLGKLEAPDTFLTNFHQRLAQTEGRERISRREILSRREETSRGYSQLLFGRGPQVAGALTVALIVFLVFNPFQMGQRLSQNAKPAQPQETAPPETAQYKARFEESKEMAGLGSSEPQTKSVPAPVTDNQSGTKAFSIAGTDDGMAGNDKKITGERTLVLTIPQPGLMAKNSEKDVYYGVGDRNMNGEGETLSGVAPEQNQPENERQRRVGNSTVFLKVRDLIKSVAGEIVGEEFQDGEKSNLPTLRIRIPVQNYNLFLEKLGAIGSVDTDGVDASDSGLAPSQPGQTNEQFVEARLVFKGIF